MRRWDFLCALCALLIGLSASVTAAPIKITIPNSNIAADGSLALDVLVSGADNKLAVAGFNFQVTPIGGTSSTLSFVEEDEVYLADAGYVFAGNSASVVDGLPSSVGAVSTTVLPNDTFIGGDGTANAADVTLSASNLLIRLLLKHSVGPADPATTMGHSFQLSLVPTSGSSAEFGGGTSDTGFLDAAGAPVAFESTSGTITVAVPEPASIACVAMALAAVLGRRYPKW